MRLQIWKAARREKQKMESDKKNREIHRIKQRHPKVAAFIITYPCLTSRRFQLALILDGSLINVHPCTPVRRLNQLRAYSPPLVRKASSSASVALSYDKLHRVLFRSPELRLDSGQAIQLVVIDTEIAQ